MSTSHTVLFLVVLLLLGVFSEPLARKLRLPFGLLLVIIGFLGSELFTKGLGVDTGIRWDSFVYIVNYLILPALIFQGALGIDIRLLWKNIIPIGLLSCPLMLISSVVIAACVFYGIGNAAGFPWVAALITGILLSATEPMAVLPLLKQHNTPERLSVLLEGESLFNDTTAVVIFSIFITVVIGMQDTISVEVVLLRLVEVFFGGLAVGIVVGLLAFSVIKIITGRYVLPLIYVILPYAVFMISKDLFDFSGIIAVLSSGLIVAACRRRYILEKEYEFTRILWQFLAYITGIMIFLLAGITFTLSMFIDRWGAMYLAIIAVLLARAIMVFGTFPLLNTLLGTHAIPGKQQAILVWGGLRGTVTLALALSLPLTLDYWYTIQSMAYAVVLFTLIVQATTMPMLVRKFYPD